MPAVPAPRPLPACLFASSAPPVLLPGTAGTPVCDSPPPLPAAASPSTADTRNGAARRPNSAVAPAKLGRPARAVDSDSSSAPSPPAHRRAVRCAPNLLASRPPPRAEPWASELFSQHRLQCLNVQRLLRHHLLQPPVFFFQAPQPTSFIHLQATILRLPAVVRLVADPVLPTDLLDRHPGFSFLQNPNNLFLRKSALLHDRLSSPALYPRRTHISAGPVFGGQVIPPSYWASY